MKMRLQEIRTKGQSAVESGAGLGLAQLHELVQLGAPGAFPRGMKQPQVALTKQEIGGGVLRIGGHGTPRRAHRQIVQGRGSVVALQLQAPLATHR